MRAARSDFPSIRFDFFSSLHFSKHACMFPRSFAIELCVWINPTTGREIVGRIARSRARAPTCVCEWYMRISGRVYNNRLPVPGPLLPSRGLSSGDVCANCEALRFETRSLLRSFPSYRLDRAPLSADIFFSLSSYTCFIENIICLPSRVCVLYIKKFIWFFLQTGELLFDTSSSFFA